VSPAKVTIKQMDWTQRVRHVPGTEQPVDGISTKQINSQYQMISPVRSMEQINYLLARCTRAVSQGCVRGGWTQCVNSVWTIGSSGDD
jgi:carbohydrate-binding DOMON domain-containing protein